MTPSFIDLNINKTTTTPTVTVGQPVTFQIVVGNSGNANVVNAQITDIIPSQLTFVSASGPGITCTAPTATMTCTSINLAPGASTTITVNTTANAAIVNGNNSTQVSDYGSNLPGSDPDSQPANDTDPTTNRNQDDDSNIPFTVVTISYIDLNVDKTIVTA